MILNTTIAGSGGSTPSTQSVTYDRSSTMYALLQTEDTAFPTELIVGQTAYIYHARTLKDGCHVTNTTTSANVPLTSVTVSSAAMDCFTMPDAPVLVYCK